MANTKSAAKRARQTVRRTTLNRSTLTGVKSLLKKTRQTLSSGDGAAAKADLANVASALDKAVNSGRIHKNTANRHKSRLQKALVGLQAKA